uniref:Single-stranded DNA binding protein n=1 Tax=Sphondylothamnion multifidum TaxID=193186 RepID=A0A4D6WYQ4_9FLOR|nr:hypothetical protein [Sphondylothamnion multifidum]
MNLLFATAQIATQPMVVKINNQNILVILLTVPNNKKKISFFLLHAYCTDFLMCQILDLYRKKNIIFIEGIIHINKKSINQANQISSSKKQKYIQLRIYKIQPYIYR